MKPRLFSIFISTTPAPLSGRNTKHSTPDCIVFTRLILKSSSHNHGCQFCFEAPSAVVNAWQHDYLIGMRGDQSDGSASGGKKAGYSILRTAAETDRAAVATALYRSESRPTEPNSGRKRVRHTELQSSEHELNIYIMAAWERQAAGDQDYRTTWRTESADNGGSPPPPTPTPTWGCPLAWPSSGDASPRRAKRDFCNFAHASKMPAAAAKGRRVRNADRARDWRASCNACCRSTSSTSGHGTEGRTDLFDGASGGPPSAVTSPAGVITIEFNSVTEHDDDRRHANASTRGD